MRRVYVVALAMLIAYISVACGGSGNLSRPTTFPSPSPSATVPPSSAPPPNFTIADFEGTWWLEGMYKTGDLHPGADFYINVNSIGWIEKEPAEFGLLPRPVDGGFTLTNADTGAFSGQITILYAEPDDTAVIDFTGTLSAEKDRFNMNYTGGSFPFRRADDLTAELGSFLIDTYNFVEPGGVYVLDGVSIITFNPDGTMGLTKISSTVGHWSLFRQRLIYGRQNLDDDDEYVRLTATILDDVRKLDQQILEPRISGEYTVFNDNDEIGKGKLEGRQIKESVELFAAGDLYSDWTWLNMDDGVDYCKSFNISSQGISVNPKAPDGGVVNYFNLYNGEFMLTMMDGDNEYRVIANLSYSRMVAHGVLQLNGGEIGRVSLINQNHPSFDLNQIEGHWSAGLAGEYGIIEYTPCAVINFELNGIGTVNIPFPEMIGDAMFIGPSTVLTYITCDLPGTTTRIYSMTVIKDIETGNTKCIVDREDDGSWDGLSFMERYSPPADKMDLTQFVGSYTYTNPNGDNPIDAVLSSGQSSFSFIRGHTVPPLDIVWVSNENYAFTCDDFVTFMAFYTPPEVAEKLGRYHYSDNLSAYGIRRRAADIIYCAGYNNYGQLGKGDTENGMGTVSNLDQSIKQSPHAMSCGARHTLALKYDGTVWAWGNNSLGQLGNGTTDDSSVPIQVPCLTDVIAVAAGGYHSMALKKDGKVWIWGYNDEAQLGLGPESYSSVYTPTLVPNLTDVIAISAFGDFCMVLRNDGTIWTWGSNGNYQLGDGSTNRRSGYPVKVIGLSNVTAIAAGDRFCLALESDGTVWAWGYNAYGTLGRGNFDQFNPENGPLQVLNLSNIVQISASRHCLALKDDGSVWAWGDNGFGQLGLGYDGLNVNAPVMLTTISEIGFVAAGMGVSYAVAGNGRTWSWGDNTNKKLFDNSEGFRNTPQVLDSLFFKAFICAGSEHSFIY